MSTEERITRLERTNRNLRWCLAAIVLGLVGFEVWRESNKSVALAQERATGTVRTKRLEIVNDDGKVLSSLAESYPGVVTFRMGQTGRDLRLTAFRDGGGLFTLDDGESRTSLSTSGITMGRRSATEVKERERILFRIESGKDVPKAEREEVDSFLNPLVLISVGEGRTGMVLLRNTFGKTVVSLQESNNVGAVSVSDRDGIVRKSMYGER